MFSMGVYVVIVVGVPYILFTCMRRDNVIMIIANSSASRTVSITMFLLMEEIICIDITH